MRQASGLPGLRASRNIRARQPRRPGRLVARMPGWLDIALTKCKSGARMSDPRLPSMSRTESLVMELLRGRERYGLELVDASHGTLKRGSVYVILARMEEKGFVDSRHEDRDGGVSGTARRLYRATPYGRKVHGAFALLREALALRPEEA